MYKPQRRRPTERYPFPHIHNPLTRSLKANVPPTPRPKKRATFFENGLLEQRAAAAEAAAQYRARAAALLEAAAPAVAAVPAAAEVVFRPPRRPRLSDLDNQARLQYEQKQKQNYARALVDEEVHRKKMSNESEEKQRTVTARRTLKMRGRHARGREKDIAFQAEAKENEAFYHVLNEPNGPHTTEEVQWLRRPRHGKNISHWTNELPSHTPSNRDRLTRLRSHYLRKPHGNDGFGENAEMHIQPNMHTHAPPSSPDHSPGINLANRLYNRLYKPTAKHAKHSPRSKSPRSNSSENAHVRLSPSAFKSKTAHKLSPKNRSVKLFKPKNPRSKL